MMPFPISGDAPVGSVIAYAGQLSTPIVLPTTSTPPGFDNNYPSASTQLGTTNNIEASGWMVCDGRQLYCSAYPELFQAIGYLYSLSGEATPSSPPSEATFRVPDFRGYFLRGASGNSDRDPDQSARTFANNDTASENTEDVGSFQKDALQTHDHKYSITTETDVESEGGAAITSSLATESDQLTGPPTDSLDSTNGNVRVSSETRPMNAYVYYLIKYAHVC